jgi:hypothetical protein
MRQGRRLASDPERTQSPSHRPAHIATGIRLCGGARLHASGLGAETRGAGIAQPTSRRQRAA